MSRRPQPTSIKRPTSSATSQNPQQGTTLHLPNGYHLNPGPSSSHHYQDYARCDKSRGKIRTKPSTTIDIGYSDETTDTQTHYDYYQHSQLRESRNTDCTISDDSGSSRMPYFEFDDESNKRYSRNAFSDRSMRKSGVHRKDGRITNQIPQAKDLRKVYPNQDLGWDRLYQEIPSPCDNAPLPNNLQRRVTPSDRPQSSMSSGVTSAITHGCGGKCQTFENVCYFFLQLVFAMGILIGVSLCIAGVVLRESAAKKLQVLVYIGVLLALVSALLLIIQCNARNTAKTRIKAIQNVKRSPIQMETLNNRSQANQEPLMVVSDGVNHRVLQMPQVHGSVSRTLPLAPSMRTSPPLIEEQGIPWWRNRDRLQ